MKRKKPDPAAVLRRAGPFYVIKDKEHFAWIVMPDFGRAVLIARKRNRKAIVLEIGEAIREVLNVALCNAPGGRRR